MTKKPVSPFERLKNDLLLFSRSESYRIQHSKAALRFTQVRQGQCKVSGEVSTDTLPTLEG